MKRRNKYIVCVLSFVLILMTLFAGCDNESNTGEQKKTEDKQTATTTKKEPVKTDVKEIEITLYYPTSDASKLVKVKKRFETKDPYSKAVKELINGTDEKDLIGIFPKDVKLRGITLEKGIARVDFSEELVENFAGGSTSEQLLVASLVNTLTEFKEIKAVEIFVAGKPIETLSGHLDLTEPVERMENLLK